MLVKGPKNPDEIDKDPRHEGLAGSGPSTENRPTPVVATRWGDSNVQRLWVRARYVRRLRLALLSARAGQSSFVAWPRKAAVLFRR